jgi:hypothetical protein
MIPITDEMLSAYLDGETDAETSARIERAVGETPELAARLEAMSRGDDLLRDAADGLLGQTPPAMARALQAPAAPEVVTLRPRASRPAISPQWMQLAAAGVAALVIGGVGGSMLTPQPQALVSGSTAGLTANAQLAEALSTARSGQDAAVGGAAMKVSLSFRARDGRLCRQFALTGPQAGSAGVACRDAGSWRIEGWTSARGAPATGYRTAGGPDQAAIAVIADGLGVAEPLDADGETRAIKAGWVVK